MSHYFAPLLVEELINLLRLGKIKIPQGRWLYSQPIDILYSQESPFFEQIKEMMPSFEDTISVVIAEFSNCQPVTPKNYSYVEFSFKDAITVYALTSHDRDILKSRLSRAAKLSENLLIEETVIQRWKTELFEERSLQGAEALLSIYQGQNHQFCNDEVQRKALLNALHYRNNDCISPINNGSYLDNLICYSRSGPIPNTDFGFLWDVGCVLRYFLGQKPKKEVVDPCHLSNPSFIERANNLIETDASAKFDDRAKIPGALVSSLVFLKLCFLIREHNESLSREKLHSLLGEIHDQASVARGVWWCGGFWGFTQFTEEYYAIASKMENQEPRFPSAPKLEPTAIQSESTLSAMPPIETELAPTVAEWVQDQPIVTVELADLKPIVVNTTSPFVQTSEVGLEADEPPITSTLPTKDIAIQTGVIPNQEMPTVPPDTEPKVEPANTVALEPLLSPSEKKPNALRNPETGLTR